jgi:hypothetical protein
MEKIDAPVCLNILVSMSDTISVAKYTRDNDGNFVCPYCKETKKKQNTMHYHIKRVHEQDFPFQCKLCPNPPKFLQRSSYYHHLATTHPENPHPSDSETNQYATVTYSCPSCPHATHTKANTLIHYARTHCANWIPSYHKDTPCPGCKKSFQSSSAYLYHAIRCLRSACDADQSNIISRIK